MSFPISEAVKAQLRKVYIPHQANTFDEAVYALGLEDAKGKSGWHSPEAVLQIEKKYETRIEELEQQVAAARDIANANHGACERAREAMGVVLDLAAAVPSRHHERVALAALHAIAHICDNTSATSKYCDVGELPF